MVDFLIRATACHRRDEPLGVHLKRFTDCGLALVDMTPKRMQQLFHPILQASHEAEGRQEIMKHLCGCLSEPIGKKWRRIFGGMMLTGKLIAQGSNVLMIETAHGYHFDLVQKVSLLEHFDSCAHGCTDERAQPTVRSKARELRTALERRLKKASCEALPPDSVLDVKDNLSTCSFACMSTTTGSTAADSGVDESESYATSDVALESPAAGASPCSIFHEVEPEGTFNSMDSQRSVECTKLQDALQRIVESKLVDIPEELFTPVIDASNDNSFRRIILMFLQNCLSQQQQQQQQPQALEPWRRVYSGLVLAQQLLVHGSPMFFVETGCGLKDVDLASEVYFLQFFEYRTDWRAQRLVRKKATELRERLIERFQHSSIGMADHDAAPNAHIDDAFVDLRLWVDDAQNCPVSFSARPSSEDTCEETFQELMLEQLEQARVCTPRSPLRSTKDSGASPARKPEGEVPVAREEFDDAFFTPLQTEAIVSSKCESPLHRFSL